MSRGTASIFPAPERRRPPSFPRQPELDALRFFAFACVFAYHLWVPAASPLYLLHQVGAFGLCLFFLLSAYLIVTLLLREKQETGRIHVRAFLVRRAFRILPLYLFAVLLSTVLGLFWPLARIPFHATLSMLGMVANVYVLKHGWVFTTLAPLWSISVEEQFYLCVPWMVRLPGRRSITAAFALALAASYGALWQLGRSHADVVLRVWPDSLVHLQFFAAGALIALCGIRLRHAPVTRLLLLSAGLASWWLSQEWLRVHLGGVAAASGPRLCLGYALVLGGTVAIFLAFLGTSFRFPRIWLRLGVISYGLYVFHQFWIDFFFVSLGLVARHRGLATVLVLSSTIVSAELAFRYLERPFLRLKRRFELVKTPL